MHLDAARERTVVTVTVRRRRLERADRLGERTPREERLHPLARELHADEECDGGGARCGNAEPRAPGGDEAARGERAGRKRQERRAHERLEPPAKERWVHGA